MLRLLKQISCRYRGPANSYCGLSLREGHAERIFAIPDTGNLLFAVPLCLVVPADSSAAVPVSARIAGVSLPVCHANCTVLLTPQAGPQAFFGSDVFRENQIH